MTLKRRIGLYYLHFFTFLLKLKKLKKTEHYNCSSTAILPEDQIDIFTVAFNNEKYIEYQIKLVRKFIRDPHVSFIVADNSSIPEKRKIISSLCQKYEVGYISVPDSMIIRYPGGSYAHGTTLNWLFYCVVKIRKPRFFGFLDHDLYPIAPISIKEKLNNRDFYGYPIDKTDGWWLWAGLCFFDFNKVGKLPLNFIPYTVNGTYLDTGGANFPVLYQKYQLKSLNLPGCENIQIMDGTEYHTNYVQVMDGCWLHTINGSNWKGVSPEDQQKKEQAIDDKLQQILSTCNDKCK